MAERGGAARSYIEQVAAVRIRRARGVEHNPARHVRIVGKEAIEPLRLAEFHVVVGVRSSGLQDLERFRIAVLDLGRAQLIGAARSDGCDRRLSATIQPAELFLVKCVIVRRTVRGGAHGVEAITVVAEIAAAADYLRSAIYSVGVIKPEVV